MQNEAASLLQAALAQTRPVRPIPERWQLKGGISAGDGEAYDKAAFKQQMEEHYMPVDLDFPGASSASVLAFLLRFCFIRVLSKLEALLGRAAAAQSTLVDLDVPQ